MHYYQFNIGDYVKSTRHLSPIEDLIYRRLLDLCYDTEKPLPDDPSKVARLIGLSDNPSETQAVLDDFFHKTQKGYTQKRVQKELKKYSAKASAARANGKLGGRPKKTQSVNLANPELTQSKAKQEPRNNKHTIEQKFDKFWHVCPKRVDRKKAFTVFKNLSCTKQDLAIEDIATRYTNTEKRFIPNPTTYLHGERWNDEREPTTLKSSYAEGLL